MNNPPSASGYGPIVTLRRQRLQGGPDRLRATFEVEPIHWIGSLNVPNVRSDGVDSKSNKLHELHATNRGHLSSKRSDWVLARGGAGAAVHLPAWITKVGL